MLYRLNANGRRLYAAGLRLGVFIKEPGGTGSSQPDALISTVPGGWGQDEFPYKVEYPCTLQAPVFTAGAGSILVAVNGGVFISIESANAEIANLADGSGSFLLRVQVTSNDATTCTASITVNYF